MNRKIDEFEVKFDQSGVVRDVAIKEPVTLVTLDFESLSATGMSRCGRHDKFNAAIGIAIAYRRALKKLAEMDEELGDCNRFFHVGSLEYIKGLL